MIIRKEVNVPAKYFLNPISPEGADYFPSKEGFISCRQATFSNNHLYADNRFLNLNSFVLINQGNLRCVGFAIQHDILSGFAIRQHFRCEQFPSDVE